MVPFSFAGEEFALAGAEMLYWPRERALLVADLHLEKASFYARHGQFLPPYDSRETLARLAAALRATAARRVLCLGDNFHDPGGAARLEPHAAGMLEALALSTDWVWIGGNHDGEVVPPFGTALAELALAGMVLRHRAEPAEPRPELSGHFHPRLRIAVRGRRIVRRCAVRTARKLVLPACGALTGGMDAADPAIRAALGAPHAADALLSAGGALVQYPLWRAEEPLFPPAL